MPSASAAPSASARSASAAQPLSPRCQLCQDITVTLGPAITAINLAGTLRHADLIPLARSLCPIALVTVPLAVCTWHAAARPAPPPASPACRVLTQAVAWVTLLTAAAGTAAVLLALHRHTAVTLWDLPTLGCPVDPG